MIIRAPVTVMRMPAMQRIFTVLCTPGALLVSGAPNGSTVRISTSNLFLFLSTFSSNSAYRARHSALQNLQLLSQLQYAHFIRDHFGSHLQRIGETIASSALSSLNALSTSALSAPSVFWTSPALMGLPLFFMTLRTSSFIVISSPASAW